MPQRLRNKRCGEEKTNNQGCLMKIVEYNSFRDIVIEFQDEYKTIIKSQYHHFLDGTIQNPYYPTVYGVGIVGNKYPSCIKGINRHAKEYEAWRNILCRSFDNKYKDKKPTYKNVTCCKEWFLYESFYEWIHSQSNFEKWLNNEKWHVDKDIIKKGNKIYSPENCCLVPQRVNSIFNNIKSKKNNYPVGVRRHRNVYVAECKNAFNNCTKYLGSFRTPEEAFYAYKKYKEYVIKEVAKYEYQKGNITKKCYDAMLRYEVEITD